MKIVGRNACFEALQNKDISISKLLIEKGAHGTEIDKIYNAAKDRQIKFTIVETNLIDRMSEVKSHQGVLIEANDFKYNNIEEVVKKAKANDKRILIVLCDEIADPHNLGAIIRTAECAGATCVCILKNNSCPVNDTVFKTSAGAVVNIPVCMINNLAQTIDKLKEENIWVYGLEANGDNIYKTKLSGNIALVVGSEEKGIRRLVKEKCDSIVSINIFGKTNSLNASVAAAIGIYEAVRQEILINKN